MSMMPMGTKKRAGPEFRINLASLFSIVFCPSFLFFNILSGRCVLQGTDLKRGRWVRPRPRFYQE
jgi:hypothetical protein